MLLTDGAINNRDVTLLTNRANEMCLMDIPIVMVVVGKRTSTRFDELPLVRNQC